MKLTPYGYQEAGALSLVRTMLSGQKGALLADEPGVGKTAQACLVANYLAAKTVCVICPAVAKINWQREMDLWTTWGVNLRIVTPKDEAPLPKDVVINYDILWRTPAVVERSFDLVIIDESHYLKNPKSKRGKAAKRVCDKAKNVLLLSGTPLENRPSELFWQMVCMGWLEERHRTSYEEKFCDKKIKRIYMKKRPRRMWGVKHDKTKNLYWREVEDTSGASNLPQLRRFMLDKGLVRRLKKDVMPELPPKTHTVVELPRTSPWRTKLLRDVLGDKFMDGKVKTGQVKYFKSLAEAARTPEDRKRLEESIAKARRIDGEMKVIPAAQFARDKLEGGVDKIVIFAHHKEVIRQLAEELKDFKPVTLHGETSPKKRQLAVDSFQEGPEVRVFIGNYRAAGTAITLTASHHVILAELDWIPGVVSQAIDRCHRNGQKDNVTAYYLVFEDSTDARVVKSLVEKQKTLDYLLDGEESPDVWCEVDPIELFLA